MISSLHGQIHSELSTVHVETRFYRLAFLHKHCCPSAEGPVEELSLVDSQPPRHLSKSLWAAGIDFDSRPCRNEDQSLCGPGQMHPEVKI